MADEVNTLRSSLENALSVNESLASQSICHDGDRQVYALQAEINRVNKAHSSVQTRDESRHAQGASPSSIDLLSKENADKLTSQENEIFRLTEEVNAHRSSLEKAGNINESLDSRSIDLDGDKQFYEEKLASLQAEIDRLNDVNSALQAEYQSLKVDNAASISSTDELMRELAEVNRALQRLQNEHRILKSDLDDTKDTNVTLEEAIQDIQVEKEDLEAENEGNLLLPRFCSFFV
jgi:chromosome segregation ATPase